MKDTLIIQILGNWEKLSQTDKLHFLQGLEHETSEQQGRFERKLLIDEDLGSALGGVFYFDDPDHIYLPELKNKAGIYFVNSTIHEGYHAYIWDHIHGRSGLTLYGSVDKYNLYLEKMHQLHLQHMCKGTFADERIFGYTSLEEKLVRRETVMHLIYNLVKSCENKEELKYITAPFVDLMCDMAAFEFNRKFYDKSDYFKRWIELCEFIGNDPKETQINPTTAIEDNQNPSLVNNYETALELFKENLLLVNDESINNIRKGSKIILESIFDEPGNN